MRTYSFLILAILATIKLQEILSSQPGPCRKLSQTFNTTKLKGKLIHRSIYLDVFSTRKHKSVPLNLCTQMDFPNPKQKNAKIIGTDDQNFVVLYECHYYPVTKSHREFVNTYTRLRTPKEDTLKKISKAFTDNGLYEKQVLLMCS